MVRFSYGKVCSAVVRILSHECQSLVMDVRGECGLKVFSAGTGNLYYEGAVICCESVKGGLSDGKSPTPDAATVKGRERNKFLADAFFGGVNFIDLEECAYIAANFL